MYKKYSKIPGILHSTRVVSWVKDNKNVCIAAVWLFVISSVSMVTSIEEMMHLTLYWHSTMNHAFVTAVHLSERSLFQCMWWQFLFLFILPRTLLEGRLNTAANNRKSSFIVKQHQHLFSPFTFPQYYPMFIISPVVWRREGFSKVVPGCKCLTQMLWQRWFSHWA